ncbi:hypothetical protein FSP39_016533 [Pinctada imbricata]|uniref:C1q domain-containing protein n=1 Tax=Pinctada imbricata TaxID=66713 RepID=A0AA88Y844_PINIB|nr:hypothetical protein FSP39_016533 [Pinctada imbricata]
MGKESTSELQTEMRFLRQLLIEERNARTVLETRVAALESGLQAVEKTAKPNEVAPTIQLDTRALDEFKDNMTRLTTDMKLDIAANRLKIKELKNAEGRDIVAEMSRNSSDMFSKINLLTNYLTLSMSDSEWQNKFFNQSIMEVKNDLKAFDDRFRRVETDVQSYSGQLMTNSMAVNNSLEKMSTLEQNIGNRISEVGSKVGFYAYSTSAEPSWAGSAPILFENVVNNIGGGLNESSSIFTAPVDGLYVFIWTTTTYEGHSFNSYIVLNGQDVKYLYINAGTKGGYETGSTSALLDLVRGDRVWIRGEDGGRLDYPNIVFTGFKI